MVCGEAEPLYGRHHRIYCCSHVVRGDLSDQRVEFGRRRTYPEKERDFNEDQDHGRNTAHVSVLRQTTNGGTHSSSTLKRMRRLKLKMLAMPNAKPNIMLRTPVLRGLCQPSCTSQPCLHQWNLSQKHHRMTCRECEVVSCSIKSRFAKSRDRARSQRYTPLSINTCERCQLHAQTAVPVRCSLKFRDLNSSASVISAAGSKGPESPEDSFSQSFANMTNSVPNEADVLASQNRLKGPEVYAAARG